MLLWIVPAARLDAQDPESGKRRSDITYAGVEYNYVHFQDDLDPWRMITLSQGQRGAWGTIITRVNIATRFQSNGVQGEVDVYPRINDKVYAFVNIGYSGAAIFPKWRSGGELFASLPRAWEVSAGYRQLRFNGLPVTLLTGAVGKYIGNSWISARPYVRVRDDGVAASVGVTGRKYFADADNYIGARVSAGSSPSERSTPAEVNRSNSWSAAVQGSRSLRPRIVANWSTGFEREELSATTARKRIDVTLGLRFQL